MYFNFEHRLPDPRGLLFIATSILRTSNSSGGPHTVNEEIFMSANFQICNFRVQIFSDTSLPSENFRPRNFPVLNFVLTRGITFRSLKLNLPHSLSHCGTSSMCCLYRPLTRRLIAMDAAGLFEGPIRKARKTTLIVSHRPLCQSNGGSWLP